MGSPWHARSILGIPPAAGAAKPECNKGEREKAAVKTYSRTNKGEIRHEDWEGVRAKTEAFREIASIGGTVQELLREPSGEMAKMEVRS